MKEGSIIQNIGRCPRCGIFLVEEQVSTHECQIRNNGSCEIVVDHFLELSQHDSEGHRLVVAQGLDGVQYWLVECKHNPPHSTKRKFTDEDAKQGLDRTCVSSIYIEVLLQVTKMVS